MIAVRRFIWKHEKMIAKQVNTIKIYFSPETTKAVLFEEGFPQDLIIRLTYRNDIIIDNMTVAQANRIMQYPVPILNWKFEDCVYLQCIPEQDMPEGEFTTLQMIDLESYRYY